MQKERERADSSRAGLSMTRSALYAYEARARKLEDEAADSDRRLPTVAPSLRNPHRTGAIRRPRLEQELVTARRDLDTAGCLAAKASEEVARARQTAERDSLVAQLIKQERARAEQLKRDLALAKQVATKCVTVGLDARDKPTKTRSQSATGHRRRAFRANAQPIPEKPGAAAFLRVRARCSGRET